MTDIISIFVGLASMSRSFLSGLASIRFTRTLAGHRRTQARIPLSSGDFPSDSAYPPCVPAPSSFPTPWISSLRSLLFLC